MNVAIVTCRSVLNYFSAIVTVQKRQKPTTPITIKVHQERKQLQQHQLQQLSVEGVLIKLCSRIMPATDVDW